MTSPWHQERTLVPLRLGRHRGRRPGKAKGPPGQKEEVLALDGKEKEKMLLAAKEKRTVPGQALGMTEVQPSGCEDTAMTTLGLAKRLA